MFIGPIHFVPLSVVFHVVNDFGFFCFESSSSAIYLREGVGLREWVERGG